MFVPHKNPPGQVMGAGVDAQTPEPQVPGPTKVCPEQLPQVRAACGGPDGTGEHLPSRPATSHAWQAPVHALSQQYPSTHIVPLTQPAATVVQVWPCLLLHVPAASQVPAQRPVGSV